MQPVACQVSALNVRPGASVTLPNSFCASIEDGLVGRGCGLQRRGGMQRWSEAGRRGQSGAEACPKTAKQLRKVGCLDFLKQ